MIVMMMKLALALLFGLLIGLDRQMKQKQLGMRPSMVICIASCLLTIVSIEAFGKFGGADHPNMDPMRLAAQIVSGVGFIGAGVILRRSNEVISGLTSAALIWSASALGVAIGAGFYAEAICGVLLLIAAVNLVPILLKSLGSARLNRCDVSLKVVVESNPRMTELIRRIQKNHMPAPEEMASTDKAEFKIRHFKLKDLDSGRQRMDLVLSVPEHHYLTEIYYYIKKIDHVLSVEVEQL
ncbi:MgtC/SapB family protein [Paenibacillus thiaminolyticus]|uniref:MgtC/SapB family protein n=1 Tax=Paenibacillus thiaminolyticus TaxID=49283 RepID=A0AAP9DSF6_PANTH|nr:MgtC/SapB family protein [Paenibacillus thiaminolyticus]MCY9538444.1 MgtC/SapB family protein [Paenibacillus thiaminolyticus]MCY9601181.1 MgtC/SapB family protein [Paenibacillus thiaminolyticus]MCY9605891.1 MgtC/SapB family protein [Paenibacillus thiaminolyticus]MCY9611230.1 MgtC/SapB family protein [Paenibacillus thiaminolyticus]MCY9617459.1 MgtC/SapB family protein [Paenibacillus thiaminolyticus]